MTLVKSTLGAIALGAALSSAAFAEDYVKGKVKKIDAGKGKVTLIHEEIPNLEMPAMTMVFKTGEDQMAGALEEGQEIEFQAERINGKLTITKIKE